MSAAVSFITSAISLVFALTVLDQYMEKRKPYQLVWSIGLGLYAVASFLQGLWGVDVNGAVVFRLWYFTGAMLVAAYLGMGTIYLLVPRKIAHVAMAVLVALTLAAFVWAMGVSLSSKVSFMEGQALTSVVPGVESHRYYPAYVGALTAFLNSAGALALVGGATYSAFVYLRRKEPGHRVVSNVLIAIGSLVSAGAGILEKFDVPEPHTVALLLGVVIIYIGFLRSREVFSVYRIPFMRRTKEGKT